MKKMITAAVLLAGLLGMVQVAHAAELEGVSNGAVQPGEWNGSFTKSREYATQNQLPLFVFWSNPGCAKCNKMKTALNEPDFKAWRAAQKIVFCFSEGDGTVKLWTKNSSGHFPYMRFYWEAAGVDARFSGRSGEIGAGGATLQAQVMNRLTALLGNAVVKPSTGPTTGPVIGDEWKRARTLTGAYRDEDGRFQGILTVKLGRVDKKGNAKVSARVTGLDSKSKAFRTVVCKVDRTTSYSANATVGDIRLTVNGSKVAGTFTPANGKGLEIVSGVTVGGSVPNGAMVFSMDDELETVKGIPVIQDWLPYYVRFTSASSRWTLPAKGRGKFDRKNNNLVNTSKDNPAALQLVYNSSKGKITGKCYAYCQRNATSVSAVATKIQGLWINGAGYCQLVATGADTVPCKVNTAD